MTIAITGASGSIYAERLISELLTRVDRIYIILTDAAIKVIPYELSHLKVKKDNFSLLKLLRKSPQKIANFEKIKVFENDDLFAPIASGSSVPQQMIVLPCSMGTLGRIRSGSGQGLIDRSADVIMKERRRLILCPRETPFSTLHLENMLALSKYGVYILPPSASFYNRQKSFDDLINSVVGKILEAMDFNHTLYPQWNEKQI